MQQVSRGQVWLRLGLYSACGVNISLPKLYTLRNVFMALQMHFCVPHTHMHSRVLNTTKACCKCSCTYPQCRPQCMFFRVGQNHIYTVYVNKWMNHTPCMHGIFDREITKFTVIYGVYIRFWPTRHVMHSGHFVTTHIYPNGTWCLVWLCVVFAQFQHFQQKQLKYAGMCRSCIATTHRALLRTSFH